MKEQAQRENRNFVDIVAEKYGVSICALRRYILFHSYLKTISLFWIMKQFESHSIRFIFILLSNFLLLMQGYCLKMFYTYFCTCPQECTHATWPMWKLKESFLSFYYVVILYMWVPGIEFKSWCLLAIAFSLWAILQM